MTRRVLNLRENIALASYCQEHWPTSNLTVEAFAKSAAEDLDIDGLNHHHVSRVVSELELKKTGPTDNTVLARLADLEAAVSILTQKVHALYTKAQ